MIHWVVHWVIQWVIHWMTHLMTHWRFLLSIHPLPSHPQRTIQVRFPVPRVADTAESSYPATTLPFSPQYSQIAPAIAPPSTIHSDSDPAASIPIDPPSPERSDSLLITRHESKRGEKMFVITESPSTTIHSDSSRSVTRIGMCFSWRFRS